MNDLDHGPRSDFAFSMVINMMLKKNKTIRFSVPHTEASPQLVTAEDTKNDLAMENAPKVEEFLPVTPKTAAAMADADEKELHVFPPLGYTATTTMNQTFFIVFFGLCLTSLLFFTAQGFLSVFLRGYK
ncbi:unnamed protein product [Amoebophrya sp. A120]|nr:unnamed protein product [Amoebophrya sp. A120]|eukprot:GSA120T00006526001.1